MKRLPYYALIFFFTGFLITGCRLFDELIPKTTDPSNPIKRVAILPLQNDTTDVEGPDYVRSKLVQAFKDKHYNVKPIAEVDRLLRDKMGATLGGQLKAVTPQKFKNILDVEGVVFGTLMNFDETTTGVYNSRKVRGNFKLLNCLTNETFWENGIGVKSQDSTGDLAGMATTLAADLTDKGGDKDIPWVTIESDTTDYNAGENFVMSLGKKLFKKATDTHLEKETEEMIRRITETLPSGPGMSSSVAQTSFPMPEIKMPVVPSFGYMDYGPKDFSAILHSTSVNNKDKQRFTSKIPIAKAGKKYRMEMDFGKATPGAQMPSGLSTMVTIHRGDKKLTYSLYPNQKKYLVFKETDENYYDIPKVEKTKVGKEKVDGHPTDKYKVKITYKNGIVQNGFIWNAKDLNGMTIKSEINEKDYRFTTILKNISLKKPSGSQFNIPSGYSEANNMMELIMNQK